MYLPDYDEEYIIFGLLSMLGNRLQTASDAFYEEITAKQWLALAMIDSVQTDHAPTLKEVAALLGSSHQNVKQIILKLEKKGYVTIKKDEHDRRSLRIYMTDKIEEFRTKYTERQMEFVKELYNGINRDSLKTVQSVLIRLEHNLKEMEERNENKNDRNL